MYLELKNTNPVKKKKNSHLLNIKLESMEDHQLGDFALFKGI